MGGGERKRGEGDVCVCVWEGRERGGRGMCVMAVRLWYPQDGLFLWSVGSAYGDNW